MKICLAQLNYHIGDFDLNVARIQEAIVHAKEKSADVVVFSELAVCGYPPRDFLEFNDFLGNCMNAIEKIALHPERWMDQYEYSSHTNEYHPLKENDNLKIQLNQWFNLEID